MAANVYPKSAEQPFVDVSHLCHNVLMNLHLGPRSVNRCLITSQLLHLTAEAMPPTHVTDGFVSNPTLIKAE